MKRKMIEALNRTVKMYETIYASGDMSLADEAFKRFMIQRDLVMEVTGKSVDIQRTKDGYRAILK